MHLLRSGTLSVRNVHESRALYETWLDYETVQAGSVSGELADSWGCPGVTGAAFAVLRSQSGADIFLRLIESPPVAGFVPLTTFGWAALEFCVQDVLAVNEKILGSPFEIIGPPRRIEGLDAIFPMQVKGPDGEILYFTQINSDLPEFTLPRAKCPIDHLFINVLAASDMFRTQGWMVEHLGLAVGRDKMEIEYTMLAKAFGAPPDRIYAISTMVHDKDVFFEVDQMPEAATERPRHPGLLPPGVAMTSIRVPDLSAVSAPFIAPPDYYDGPIYQGQLSACVQDPDGALFELVQMEEGRL